MKIIPEYSTIELLKAELAKLGYTYKTIVLGDDNYTQFTSPLKQIWITSNTHINYPFASSSARTISDKKYLAYELAESIGVRIPLTRLINVKDYDPEKLLPLLESAPLVIKPNNASLSHGLSLNVSNEEQLYGGIEHAAAFSEDVLIQEQVLGQEIRFVVLDGDITAALLRETPRLVGDGKQTIGELLIAENADRRTINVPYLTYPELGEPLVEVEGLELTRILPAGEFVELGKSTMIRGGASVYNVIENVHPSYLQTAQRLANTLGQGFVVVDIFIEDYRLPQTTSNYAFVEFNMSPVLKLCYSCRDGHNYDVLSELVPLIDRSLHRKVHHE